MAGVVRERQKQSSDTLVKELIREAREALKEVYRNHPELKRNEYATFSCKEEKGTDFLVRIASRLSEGEEARLAMLMSYLRRVLFRRLVRERGFLLFLESLVKERLTSEGEAGRFYDLVECDNIAISKEEIGSMVWEIEEALRTWEKSGNIKDYARACRLIRKASIRWGVVQRFAKTQSEDPLNKHIAEVLKQISDVFVVSNLRLVPYVLSSFDRKMNIPGDIRDDLAGEGIMGLYKALDKYDRLRHGVKFVTYATWWIKQTIARAVLLYSRRIPVPPAVWERITRLRKAEAELESELCRKPTDRELCRKLGISLRELFYLDMYDTDAVSLDAPIVVESSSSKEEGSTLLEMISDRREGVEEAVEKKILKELLLKIIYERLTPIEAEVILARIGFFAPDATLSALGEKYNRSRQWVKMVEQRALAKLRIGKHAQVLYSFVSQGEA